MPKRLHLLPFLALLITLQITAQNLPGEWSISPDGRNLTGGGDNDSGFFNLADIHDIQLEFTQADFWQQMLDNYDTGTDILATCWIDGVQYDSVGVRFKGATSFFQNNTEKKSFNISLDYMIEDQEVDGNSTLNLNCGWGDNTSMREVLYNNVGHHYYMSLKANYSTLSINGENWGPYQTVQQFNSNYIKQWYLSNDGTIWRAARIGNGSPGSQMFGKGKSTLNYNGPDSTDYNIDYTLKRTEQIDPWSDLIEACDVLNNEPLATLEQELAQVLDIDKTCWFLAHESVWADDDSYLNKGGSDYYLYYEAETDRLVPMEYDGNSVLGGNHIFWDLFYHSNDEDFPLLNRMLAVPAIRQRFLAHVRVILEDYFNPIYTDDQVDALAAMIDQLVQDDPKKFYNYNMFLNAVQNLKQRVATRRNHLYNDPELNNIESLNVGEVSYAVNSVQWQTPTAADEVDVVALITGTAGISSVYLYYGDGFTGTFTKLEMYDDGLHNDGAANDGQYGASIPPMPTGTYMRYYIEAIADDAAATASYEPRGAEHDVFLYQVNVPSVNSVPVVINELMAKNETATADEAGEYDDWIELYNVSSAPVDLSGWSLTDDLNELDKYIIPSGTTLTTDGYLIIWADDDTDQGPQHASFKLSADGEQLSLLNPAQELVDQVTFPAATEDLAYARIPNGVGDFVEQAHTIGANNEIPTSVSDPKKEIGFKLYPNPARDEVKVKANGGVVQRLSVSNALGQVVWEGELGAAISLDVSSWTAGVYFFRAGGEVVQVLVVR